MSDSVSIQLTGISMSACLNKKGEKVWISCNGYGHAFRLEVLWHDICCSNWKTHRMKEERKRPKNPFISLRQQNLRVQWCDFIHHAKRFVVICSQFEQKSHYILKNRRHFAVTKALKWEFMCKSCVCDSGSESTKSLRFVTFPLMQSSFFVDKVGSRELMFSMHGCSLFERTLQGKNHIWKDSGKKITTDNDMKKKISVNLLKCADLARFKSNANANNLTISK